jgi:hypothetical protein
MSTPAFTPHDFWLRAYDLTGNLSFAKIRSPERH